MIKKRFTKKVWKDALGAKTKPRRLKLNADTDGNFSCPVPLCEQEKYRSKRGCRKHVFNKHGWFYYFDTKPEPEKVFPSLNTRENTYELKKKAKTSSMPMFQKTCKIGCDFKTWLQSPGGGGKMNTQADQTLSRILKYLKFCCNDVSPSWDLPDSVVDYCIGSVTMLSDFVEYLQQEWSVGYAGLIAYMNSISHLLDFRRSSNSFPAENVSVFVASEIYIQRVKRYLSKKMKLQWHELLTVEYLDTMNCWATLEDLQRVIPFHSDKYKQIILNASSASSCVPSHDLTFSTSFIVAVLFLMVKASRPMTYIFLTVEMIQSIQEEGIINQTLFKTNETYGFDSLMFSKEVLTLINGYIDHIRPRLNPLCNYLLISRKGNQILKLTNIFGRIVFEAIGKYINPTRYRQIVETESIEKLSSEEQTNLSKDQKHTSTVAKIHYQKLKSEEIAKKAKLSMEKLCDKSVPSSSISEINLTLRNITEPNADLARNNDSEQCSSKKLRSSSRLKKVPFSDIEDEFLRKGVAKYGQGKWTSILNDKTFKFHSSRKVSTLAVRAKKVFK